MSRHDYGPVTSYAYAVEHGYFSGTEAEWIQMLGNTSQNASDAEAYAKGTRSGTPVGSSDTAYHNNSKYYADQASNAVTEAQAAKMAAETAETNAAGSATAASGSATAASGSATDAEAAKTAAQTAQAGAEAAQAGAEAAQAAAEAVLESIPEDYSEMSADVSNLKSQIELNANEQGLWVTGGIGSTGEDYSARNTSIRTKEYISLDDLIRFTTSAEFTTGYYALYTSARAFVVRIQITGQNEFKVEDLVATYSTAAYIKIEIGSVDGAVTEYDRVSLFYPGIKTLADDTKHLETFTDIISDYISPSMAFVIGANVYPENGELKITASDMTYRAAVLPMPTNGIKRLYGKYVHPEYTVRVIGLGDNGWDYINAGNQSTPFSVGLDGIYMIAVHAECVRRVRQTDVPCTFCCDIESRVANFEKSTEQPLNIEVGVNRYLSGTQLLSNSNTKRASTPPFRILGGKFEVLQLLYDQSYQYSIAKSTDGVVWGNIQALTSGRSEVTANIGDYIVFHIESNKDIPDGAIPIKMRYLDVMENFASVFDKNITLTEIPFSALDWCIGGVGAQGENYNRGNHTIRTDVYVNSIIRVEADEDYIFFIAEYDSTKTFIKRTQTASFVCDKSKYYRIELFYAPGGATDTTAVSDIAERASHVHIVAFADSSLSVPGMPAESKAVDDRIQGLETISTNVDDLISQSKYVYSSSDSGVGTEKTLTLLHFTDIHNNLAGMRYAMDVYSKYSANIDDMLHTGDIVAANFSDGITNWINSGCAAQVLSVIGNHDTEENLVLQAAGKDNVYNTIFAPYIDGWEVTQPEGVDDSSSGDYHALYYYKDYTDAGVRLIVLDTNFWDNAESAWLTDVLADAKTEELAVLIACHNVKLLTELTTSNFSCYKGDGISETGNAYANQPADWLDPVSDFVSGGGEFIGILAGHNHSGHMGYMTNYPDFFVYVAAKSSMGRVSGTARISGQKNQNTVSLVTINTKEKLLKIVAVGANVDGLLRPRNCFCYNYSTKQIVSQW